VKRKVGRRRSQTSPAGFHWKPLEEKLIRLALDDAAQPGEIANSATKLGASLRKRGIRPENLLQPASQIPAFGSVDYGSMIMSFGQYKGLSLNQIDRDYLTWVEANCQRSRPEMCKAIARFLESRRQGD
jgi:hypothetical protein